jgi:Na+/proline symporter
MPLSDTLIIWAIVAAYMAFIFVKGISKARRIGDTDDFLVAGRNVGWFMLFCTMGATVIGGGSSIGAIGKTYDWGVLMLLVSTGWYLHFIFSGLVVAPQFRRAELYTVAGYFGHRFGEGPRFVMMVLSLLFSVFIVAAQMAAFGSVLATLMPQFADMSRVLAWAILIGGAMVVIYSTAGGLLAVIHPGGTAACSGWRGSGRCCWVARRSPWRFPGPTSSGCSCSPITSGRRPSSCRSASGRGCGSAPRR